MSIGDILAMIQMWWWILSLVRNYWAVLYCGTVYFARYSKFCDGKLRSSGVSICPENSSCLRHNTIRYVQRNDMIRYNIHWTLLSEEYNKLYLNNRVLLSKALSCDRLPEEIWCSQQILARNYVLGLILGAKIARNGHYGMIGTRWGETLSGHVIDFDQWEHANI